MLYTALAGLLLIADLGVCLKVVKLEKKGSLQAFRGPAKLIRNLNYDGLDPHEYIRLHQSVDVRNKGQSQQSPDPSIPPFMHFADASTDITLDLKEWKSSMFCTQVDFGFPPAAPAVKLQLQLNIGIMGQTMYDQNTQQGQPGLIKAEFMLGLGGTITGSIGSMDLAASLYVQGNMVLESRVPAEYLMGADQSKAYPLLGTVWAVKQWGMNKVKNSPLYKWYKNKKKNIMNQAMTRLLQGIQTDIQGANDAAAKTDCEAYCNKPPKDCQPKNPKKECGPTGKAACSSVSADCDHGVQWQATAFVDYCGEYDLANSRCKNGEFKTDGKKDSDAVMDSASIKFKEFINELRTVGNTLFINKAAAYTAHDTSKANLYRETIEKAWRKVYLGVAEVDAIRVFGVVLYKYRIDCRDIPGAYDRTTNKVKDPTKAIMPLMCAWMKYGGSLEVPSTGWVFNDGKGNMNLKNSLIHLYKELFPVPSGNANDPNFESWILRLRTGNDPDMQVAVAERSSFLGGWTDDTTHGININAFNCHAVHAILALPADEVMNSLTAMMDDLADAGKEFENGVMASKGCRGEPATDCCGLQKVSLSGTFGVTVGDSSVGFCTPDTNPFQVIRAKALEWEVDAVATKAGGVGLIKTRVGYCFLGTGEWQPREIAVTGVIPLDNAVPSDANQFLYINFWAKGNWALTWNPEQVGITISYMTKLLEPPLTVPLTPVCVVLQAIYQPLKTAFQNLYAIYNGKPTVKLVMDLVSKTKTILPNAVKGHCDLAANNCATKSSEAGKGVLKYVALIGSTAAGVNVNTIVNAAGEWTKDLSKGLSGDQVEVGFGRNTYSQIDLKLTFDRAKGKDLTALSTWSISAKDGDTGISFSMNTIADLSVSVGGILSATGVDIKVAGYYGTGSSIDCSAQT